MSPTDETTATTTDSTPAAPTPAVTTHETTTEATATVPPTPPPAAASAGDEATNPPQQPPLTPEAPRAPNASPVTPPATGVVSETTSPARDRRSESPQVTTPAAAAASGGGAEEEMVWSRADERRLDELSRRQQHAGEPGAPPLLPEEIEELEVLKARNDEFLAAGLARLQSGETPSTTSEERHGVLGSVWQGAGHAAASTASALNTVGKGVWFWSSLVATAVPGIIGKSAGVTPDFKHWSWISDRLILGALPVLSEVGSKGNHLQQLKDQATARHLNIGLVVACLQSSEMQGFGIRVVRFAQKADWDQHLGVKEYEHLSMADFGANTTCVDVGRAVEHMHDVMHRKREAVYVHCKAGKGRSWMVTMCYLMTKSGMDFDTAACTVKTARYQVNPSAVQIKFVHEFAKWYAEQPASSRVAGTERTETSTH